MKCMYVGWDNDKGIINNPVSKDMFDAVMDATAKLLALMASFMSCKSKRHFIRHQREFQKMISDLMTDDSEQ